MAVALVVSGCGPSTVNSNSSKCTVSAIANCLDITLVNKKGKSRDLYFGNYSYRYGRADTSILIGVNGGLPLTGGQGPKTASFQTYPGPPQLKVGPSAIGANLTLSFDYVDQPGVTVCEPSRIAHVCPGLPRREYKCDADSGEVSILRIRQRHNSHAGNFVTSVVGTFKVRCTGGATAAGSFHEVAGAF